MLVDLPCGLLQGVADCASGGGHAVQAFQFQRQSPQAIGKVRHRAAPDARRVKRVAVRAVYPPPQVGCGLQSRLGVLLLPQPAGV